MGEYRETLIGGATLVVNGRRDWHIEYCLRGPDLRYNFEFVRIPGATFTQALTDLEENWRTYQVLRRSVIDGELVEKGRGPWTIRVNGCSTACASAIIITRSAHKQSLSERFRAYVQRRVELRRSVELSGKYTSYRKPSSNPLVLAGGQKLPV
jgi:hypothetical protein